MSNTTQEKNIMSYETVALDDESSALVIVDQTKLSSSTELVNLHTAQEIWDAIYLLKVRDAPAIGVAAAFGIYLLAKGIVWKSLLINCRRTHKLCGQVFSIRQRKRYPSSCRTMY